MILSTTDSLPGAEITEVLGVVTASTVRTRHIGRDIQAGLRNLVGGEVGPYVQMLDDARDEATNRLIEKAEELGADAVITVRYMTSSVMKGASEILVYGTAVKTG